MILQALAQYYQRLVEEGTVDIAPQGFERKEMPFLIVINERGEFTGLQDTREGDGKRKRGAVFQVPKAVKRSSGIVANLLWDTPSYVLGTGTQNPERAAKQHDCFIATVREKCVSALNDSGVKAALKFLNSGEISRIVADPLWAEIEESGANISFKLKGENKLICEREAVIEAVTRSVKQQEVIVTYCLISGERDVPKRLHTAIKGVRGTQSSGANIVSFNLQSFTSYAKEQGENAPVGEQSEFSYTTALNHLLSWNSNQKIQVGDTTTVFWAEKKNKMETVFADIFGSEPQQTVSVQDYKELLSLFRAPESGIRKELDSETKFYVLGLAPNAARIAIRYWYAGTVGDIADNISQHFDDLEIVKSPYEWRTLSLRNLLRSSALQELDDNIRPNLAGATMKSIITGTPYPQTLLSGVITRIRADQSRRDRNGRLLPNVTFTRAALLKAFLVRETRLRDYNHNTKEAGMSLDTSITSTGYLLGRLFAVLERIQETANPGINTTIRERFYSSASSTPNAVFPQLMKLKNHHIAKLQNKGTAIKNEKQISEIMDKLDGASGMPVYLDLREQGRFAIGYYHQRQDFFTRKGN